jgi:hypothetical protein
MHIHRAHQGSKQPTYNPPIIGADRFFSAGHPCLTANHSARASRWTHLRSALGCWGRYVNS